MRARSLTVLVVLLSSGFPVARAWAQPADAPTVVLGLEALDGVPDALAAQTTDALRQQLATTKGYRLLQGKDLVEVKLVFDCPDEAPACMSQAGKSLGASKLIFGNIKKGAAGELAISLKLLDVDRGVVESFAADTIDKRHTDPSALRALAPGWLAKLSGKGGGGTIRVRANFAGGAVSLDGTRVGTTGADPVVIADVAPGRHEVAVEKSGYTTSKQEFTLAAGQSLPLNLALNPMSVEVARPNSTSEGPAGGEPEPAADTGSGRELSRDVFWVAVVGTIASAALALKFGLDVRDINRELDQYRRFPCSTSATGLCDSSGMTANPLQASDKSAIASKQSTGNRDETLQWVFVGLSGAFAACGGYFLYKGYLSGEGAVNGHEGSRSANGRGLRIFPTATASAGGIMAEFEF